MRIIAGSWGGRRIRAPEGRGVRPTTDRVREAWMSAMGPWLPGARVLDLFSGSGALGLECLSRGAREVVFVERAPGALRVLRRNLEELEARDRARVIPREVFSYLAGRVRGGLGGEVPSDDAFDLALADPPYAEGMATRLVRCFERSPFAAQLWIEHGVTEPLEGPTPSRERRYGDTLLTTFLANPAHTPDDSENPPPPRRP